MTWWPPLSFVNETVISSAMPPVLGFLAIGFALCCGLVAFADFIASSATALGFSKPLDVVWCVLVSFWAMRFFLIYCGHRVAAQGVLAACDRFKMIWVYANTISAKMVKCNVFRNWANENNVSRSVRRHLNRLYAIKKHCMAITTFIWFPPIPTPQIPVHMIKERGEVFCSFKCSWVAHAGNNTLVPATAQGLAR